MPFSTLILVFDVLHMAFYPDGIPDDVDELDERISSLFTIFLYSVNWTPKEFWDQYETYEDNHTCEECELEKIEEDKELELPSISEDKKEKLSENKSKKFNLN